MSQKSLDISVIVPAFNEEESLPELCEWIDRVMTEHQYSYEVILIDDGSTDDTWKVCTEISSQNVQVKGVKFLRNYGKSAALNTGFRRCLGDVVITMDADLQDSPDEIPGLYEMIMKEGFDLVSGWKKTRHDPISKTIPSKFFNRITRLASGIKLNDFNCGLKAYRKRVIKTIEVYGEMHRYIPVIAKWNGFKKIGEKVVAHRARKYGVSKFGLERFINGFLDLLSITFVSRFKKKPMHFFGTMGMLFFFVGFVIASYLVLDKFINSWLGNVVRDVVDQPLFFISLVLTIIGSQLFLTGFLAEMVSLNAPNRNDYHIEEEIGIES